MLLHWIWYCKYYFSWTECILLALKIQCTDEEVEHSYEEFYEDVHTEFLKFGELVNFKVYIIYFEFLKSSATVGMLDFYLDIYFIYLLACIECNHQNCVRFVETAHTIYVEMYMYITNPWIQLFLLMKATMVVISQENRWLIASVLFLKSIIFLTTIISVSEGVNLYPSLLTDNMWVC